MLINFNNFFNHYLFPLTHSLYIILFCKTSTEFSHSFSVASSWSLLSLLQLFWSFWSAFSFIIPFLITFVSISVSHPFILIILAWSHNLCSIISKPCIFKPVIHSLSISSYWFSFFIKWSPQEITFHDSYIHLFRPSCCRRFWWIPSLRCSPTGHFTSLQVPSPFTRLFLIISDLNSLILRVVLIRCHNRQYFYQDTIFGKIVSQE